MKIKTKIASFNQPGLDGRIRLANSKEHIVELLNKLDLHVLTDGRTIHKVNSVEFFHIDIFSIVAKIENICIIENGIGYMGKPIFDVYGDINFIKKVPYKLIEESLKCGLISVGLRGIGTIKKFGNDICLDLSKIICWDVIVLNKNLKY